ncbi:hypothetical protein [Novispirillum itersonii]|uniref:hypothetical protein n=1 Tax=Novispirillum itersonii TaxID=189 RepID=UPI00037AF55F|nr:hypothetical protein [Novispirillum itersonii]
MLQRIKPALLAGLTGFILLTGPGVARAETAPSCAVVQTRCDASCAARYTSEAGKVGCQARCASERGACDASAGYDQAKPWVKKKVQSVGEFFDGLTDGGESPPSEPPPAKPAPVRN